MSFYSAPERLSGKFNTAFISKKINATDHTHSDLGGGGVKASSDNIFSGENSFTNANPVKFITNGDSTQLLFAKEGDDSTNAALSWSVNSTYADVEGEMKIRAHTLTFENSDHTDLLQFNEGVGTFSAPPVCVVTASGDTQLVNKSYVDTNSVSLSAANTFTGAKTVFDNKVGIGTDTVARNLVVYADSYPGIQLRNSASSGTGTGSGFEIIQGGNGTIIANRENGSMIFETNDTDRMRILANGRIGLGTNSPAYFLDVIAINHRTTHTFSRYRGFSSFHAFQADTTSTTISDFGMRCDSNVAAPSYQAYSDRRIKENITEMNDDTSLQKLRLLKPCLYEYKDKITRGTSIVEGFIAQEVKEVLPYAVNNILQDIPNIFKMGSYDIDASNNKVITINDYDTANLELDASGNVFPKLKVLLEDNSVEYVTISSVISPSSIVIESEKDMPSGEIFIYGQNVDNFCSLDKDRIFTVATSALQEVDRQLQAEKAKTASLETQVASLLERVTALEGA